MFGIRRKTEAVLQRFRGKILDALSRELGVTPGKLAEWRDEARMAIQGGLQPREPDHRDGFIHDLKAKVGDEAMQIGFLKRSLELRSEHLSNQERMRLL